VKLERALDGPAPPSEGVQASLPFTSSRIAILATWASAGTSVDLGNVSFLHFSGTERIAALFHITIAYSEISAHLSRGIVYVFLPTSKVEAILVCLQRKHMDESLVHHVNLPARQFYSSQPLCVLGSSKVQNCCNRKYFECAGTPEMPISEHLSATNRSVTSEQNSLANARCLAARGFAKLSASLRPRKATISGRRFSSLTLLCKSRFYINICTSFQWICISASGHSVAFLGESAIIRHTSSPT
jgi:hypothetical protein